MTTQRLYSFETTYQRLWSSFTRNN